MTRVAWEKTEEGLRDTVESVFGPESRLVLGEPYGAGHWGRIRTIRVVDLFGRCNGGRLEERGGPRVQTQNSTPDRRFGRDFVTVDVPGPLSEWVGQVIATRAPREDVRCRQLHYAFDHDCEPEQTARWLTDQVLGFGNIHPRKTDVGSGEHYTVTIDAGSQLACVAFYRRDMKRRKGQPPPEVLPTLRVEAKAKDRLAAAWFEVWQDVGHSGQVCDAALGEIIERTGFVTELGEAERVDPLAPQQADVVRKVAWLVNDGGRAIQCALHAGIDLGELVAWARELRLRDATAETVSKALQRERADREAVEAFGGRFEDAVRGEISGNHMRARLKHARSRR